MPDVLRPAADWELQSIISGCIDKRSSIELIGRGSKRAVGRPVKAEVTVSTASLRGIPLYEPSEMVMSARAGTMLSQVEADLAARGQMLPFEPIDLGPAIGAGANAQTVGAVFASNFPAHGASPRAPHVTTCSAYAASMAAPRSSSPAAAS